MWSWGGGGGKVEIGVGDLEPLTQRPPFPVDQPPYHGGAEIRSAQEAP